MVVCSSRRRSIRSSSSSSSSCTRAPLSQRRVAHLAAPPPHVAVGHHVVQLPRGLRQNLGHQRRRVGRHHRAVHRHQPRRVVQVLAQVGKRLLATRVDNHRRPALQQAPREPAPDRPHASNDPASLADERHGVVNLVWGCALRWGCRSAARDASEHRRGWSLPRAGSVPAVPTQPPGGRYTCRVTDPRVSGQGCSCVGSVHAVRRCRPGSSERRAGGVVAPSSRAPVAFGRLCTAVYQQRAGRARTPERRQNGAAAEVVENAKVWICKIF